MRISAALLIVLLLAGNASAQQGQPARQGGVTPAPVAAPTQVFVNDQDAQQTREELRNLLRQYPPSVARVLALDPSLLTNESYLATYPQLAAFLAQQPGVVHNPAFYFGTANDFDRNDGTSQGMRVVENVLQGMMIFAAFATATWFVAWLLKTFVEYRRWTQVSKVHTEAHTKLLDRFTSHEDLLAYIQTPAGRRFLESAPVLEEGPKAINAPIGRVLWSVQAGVVLAFAGLGLNFVSMRVIPDVQQPLFVIGALAISLGIGFVVSAAMAYVMSRRLGLLEPRSTPNA
jgi:hypothetical protein